jgi:hypothetical protein
MNVHKIFIRSFLNNHPEMFIGAFLAQLDNPKTETVLLRAKSLRVHLHKRRGSGIFALQSPSPLAAASINCFLCKQSVKARLHYGKNALS